MQRTRIEGVVNRDSSQGFSWSPFVGCLFKACSNRSSCWAMKCLARSKCEMCRKYIPHWHAERMEQPFTLKKPSTIAVCWMGDVWRYSALSPVLNKGASKWGLHRSGLAGIMGELKQHTFLCLTRQPISYLCFCTTPPHSMEFSKNVWLGITVTSQEDVDRIGPDFARIEHPNKFISYEPILGEITDWGKLGKFGWLYTGMLTKGKCDLSNEEAACFAMDAMVHAHKIGAKVWAKNSLGEEWEKQTPWLKGPDEVQNEPI